MIRAAVTTATVAALIAAAGGGFIAGRMGHQPIETSGDAIVSQATAPMNTAPIYYQDPDGKPLYSLTPMKTPDGRAYRAVPPSADVTFDEASGPDAAASASRKIKYYRNPMGLPDLSPTPKKDSMGMDYIPVFEGDDIDDGSITLSPGKIQRTGVRSEPAAKRVIRTIVRAPGTIQLDERRVSVISMRSESFVLKVADVTTGSHVVKGQPLMEVYSPAVSSAAAEYLATITSKMTTGDASYGRGSRQRLRTSICRRWRLPTSKKAGSFRPPSSGRLRVTASSWNAMRLRACAFSRAASCSESPTIR
jgi:membrane fusion protein, copper/silver efflux system